MPTKIQGGLGIDKVQDGTVGLSDVDTELYGKITALTTINLGEARAASGTFVDFDVPLGVKRVTVMFDGVSTNGTSIPLIRLGSGSIVATGYGASATNVHSGTATWSSVGFIVAAAWGDTVDGRGHITLCRHSGNVWVCSGALGRSGAAFTSVFSGSVDIGSVIDRLRITPANGTDQFNAGTINISWEF